MTTYDLTSTTPTKLKTGDILNCPYSGTYKTVTLPKGTYKLEVWGAQGGTRSTTYGNGGKGGYSVGTLTLTTPKTVYLYAGGSGSSAGSSTSFTGGGYNGGGNSKYYGGGGGGGSDIRIGSTSLYARVIVAGGGGGAQGRSSSSYKASGGAGGGTSSSSFLCFRMSSMMRMIMRWQNASSMKLPHRKSWKRKRRNLQKCSVQTAWEIFWSDRSTARSHRSTGTVRRCPAPPMWVMPVM